VKATIVAALVLLHATICGAADVTGTVRIAGRPVSNTVVYLDGGPQNAPPPTPKHVVMDQKNLLFVPAVLPVQKGTVVDFRNSDDVQHNVFTPSTSANPFNLGTYNRGEARSVTFSKAGEAVILCNIHMEMEAHIIVVEGPYFTVTDQGGAFRISDVPAGRYELRLWQRGWSSYTSELEVGDGPVERHIDVEQ
jgi:plastocyanin